MKNPIYPPCRFTWLVLLTAPLMLICATANAWQLPTLSADKLSEEEQTAVAQIKTDAIREVVTALTDPEMAGRGAGQSGGQKAARYLADRMAKLGLKPLGGRGSFLQRVPLRSYYRLPESTVTIGGKLLRYRQDFLIDNYPLNLARLKARIHVRGDVVFAGYGIVSQALKRDDLAGLDLKGKIVALLPGSPPGARVETWDSIDWKSIVHDLAQRGAVGIFYLSSAQGFGPLTLDYAGRRGVALTALTPPAEAGFPPAVSLTAFGTERLFAGTGSTYAELDARARKGEFVSRDLQQEAEIDLRLALDPHPAASYNVVGLLAGSDPQLKAEAIVYSAHYDAYGTEKDGRVFPGAADNALGVGNMLAVADALIHSALRPQRSVIFIAETGEEAGLLGTQYWVNHPNWLLARIAADLNFDGLGTEVWGPVRAFYPAGSAQSDLAATIKEVAKGLGAVLLTPTSVDEEAYQRGDQYEFARRGIPTVYALGLGGNLLGVLAHVKRFEVEDYHQVTDTIRSDWHWDGAETLAAFYLVMGLRIANAAAMPAWLPSSPFNRARGAMPADTGKLIVP